MSTHQIPAVRRHPARSSAVPAVQAELPLRLLSDVDERQRRPLDMGDPCAEARGATAPEQAALAGPRDNTGLRLLVHDAAFEAPIGEPDTGGKVLTIQDVARRYSVSEKTVSRWRRLGLAGRRFRLGGGRKRIGFLQSEVERFVREHKVRVERGSRFRKLTDGDKREVVRQARLLATTCRWDMGEIVRSISRTMGRSAETVRSTIRAHDRSHPDDPIYRTADTQLRQEDRQRIYQAFRQGVSVTDLARRYCRTSSSVYRAVHQWRAHLLLRAPIRYMYSPEFDAPRAEAVILGPYPESPAPRRGRSTKPPTGLPPYLARLYGTPLLTRDQEAYLFRQMNYLKYRASRLQEELDPAHPRVGLMDRIERLQDEALEVNNQIIRANLRLVVSIAKRHVDPRTNLFELVSDGNVSLMRAADKFDYTRGNKFSTYATWAVMKNFSRSIPQERYRRERFVTGRPDVFEAAPDGAVDEAEYNAHQDRVRRSLTSILGRLGDREREIIVSRFGLEDGQGAETLQQVGRRFGVSKERIRQIEARALGKLRQFADELHIEVSSVTDPR